jgi:triacylglycerol lipase
MYNAPEILWLVGLLALALVVYVLARVAARRRRSRRLDRGERHDGAKGSAEPSAPRVPDDHESETSPSPPLEPAAPTIIVRRDGPTRYPIVLAHGYFGFDVVLPWRLKREYFLGVRAALESRGFRVYVPRVSPAASVAQRARQLGHQVERLGAKKVNIIAHSMGGLDARYAISKLGLHDRVASLTTIGTPHAGTPLADTTAAIFGNRAFTRRVLAGFGGDGVFDLTTHSMLRFNEAVRDAPDTQYASVVGAVSERADLVHTLLAPGFAYMRRSVGPNDGLVPGESQRWGEVLDEVEADHWAQIGWSRGLDVRAFYHALAIRLARRGL